MFTADKDARAAEVPAPGTVERWAWEYVESDSLAVKLAPPAPPAVWEAPPAARRLTAPGRPPELRVVARARRGGSLKTARGRAHLLHAFLHHELQAAELMAWALLAFAGAPREFREGLLRIALDEVRHMNLYAREIERLGFRVGDFPVRDWFWSRVPRCETPVQFVAVMGLGLEAANLDHAERFAQAFEEAGDPEAAAAERRVGKEEVAHVRFGARWFTEWTGGLDFGAWQASLPEPLSPLLMRGSPMADGARRQSGMDPAFLEELAAWQPRGS